MISRSVGRKELSKICFCCSFGRVGAIILALHDATDVFMEVGKMSKYSGAEALASCSFAVFVLLWVLLRLIYFPFWILWSTRCVVLLPDPLFEIMSSFFMCLCQLLCHFVVSVLFFLSIFIMQKHSVFYLNFNRYNLY